MNPSNTPAPAPTTLPTSATVSIADLDLVKKCDKGFEFNYLDAATGQPTEVFITVVGRQSELVQNWIRKSLNNRRMQDALQAKRGQEVVRTVEDDEEFSNEGAAIRIIGWRGITEPYSPALALQLCNSNEEIRAQVFKASNDLANFR